MSVVGVDEVGRGSWAGPLLVVAAKPIRELPDGLKDSKQLTKQQRQEFFELIRQSCQLGEGWVQPEEIDQHGLAQAMRLGVSRALIMLGAGFDDEVIIDGNVNYCPPQYANAKAVIGADAQYPIVSAASIYAKVLRDTHMTRLSQLYPMHAFEQHVGYGTELHRLLLHVHGITKIHRKSYAPIAELLTPND